MGAGLRVESFQWILRIVLEPGVEAQGSLIVTLNESPKALGAAAAVIALLVVWLM
jgi:hypothetical protein